MSSWPPHEHRGPSIREPQLQRVSASQVFDAELSHDLNVKSYVWPKSSFLDAEGRDSLLREPLLQAEAGEEPSGEPEKESTFAWTVLQLSKVILGSSMLVLPRAFQLLGVALALALLMAVGLLTWFTVAGLAYASEKRNKHTYAAVVRDVCGPPARWGLLLAVFVNCLGMCVVYMVIFGDILVGAPPQYSGVIRTLLPWLEPDSWFLDRHLILAIVTLAILTPMCLTRDLARLGPLALAGVGSVILFSVVSLGLVGAAWAQGKGGTLPLWPDWEGLAGGGGGGGGGGTHKAGSENKDKGGTGTAAGMNVHVIMGISAIVPLLLNADICHQSVFPAMQLLVPYTRKSFIWMVGTALGLCNFLYSLIAVSGILAFGTELDSNVLNNMSLVHVAPLIGQTPALIVALLVRATYFISMLGSFVFTLHPLRVCVKEVLLGSEDTHDRQRKEHVLFVPVTLCLIVLCYVVSVGVPGIWVVLSFVGSCASTFMGFVFPALVIYIMNVKAKWQHYAKRATAVFVALIGIFLFVDGLAMPFLGHSTS